jgi:translation initiation factor 2 gamma subunit (eIF-2gamma)
MDKVDRPKRHINVGTIGHVDHGLRSTRLGGRLNVRFATAVSASLAAFNHTLEDEPITPETYHHNPHAKYKRNSLCPCNSGIKYKKCHGRGSHV